MESIITQIKSLYANASSESDRRKIQKQLRDVQAELNSDWELIIGIASSPLYMVIVTIGCELNLFKYINEAEGPISLDELAEKTGAQRKLLAHLLRALTAAGYVDETAKETYGPARMTKVLADPRLSVVAPYIHRTHTSCLNLLPSFLKARNYTALTSNTDLPFQIAFNTPLSSFDYMASRPSDAASLGAAMSFTRGNDWLSVFPSLQTSLGTFPNDPESILFVDVGGGFGQQAISFRSAFPQYKGRVVVQDMSVTIAAARANPPANSEAVEYTDHDFFTAQPLKAAKIYYLRRILHDWPDVECVTILKQLAEVMDKDSRIVLDEMLVPETGATWMMAYSDMALNVTLGGGERTKDEYEGLLKQAGLGLKEVKTYDDSGVCVLIAVLEGI